MQETKILTAYELLTMQIDPEMEKYLRGIGLDWFFDRRKQFHGFIEKNNIPQSR